MLGVYRKSHIPDGPGYQEKYYFSPGDTGPRVWDTRFGRIGVGICWDQWFPELARAMALQGAELLLYPTAIGSEPPDPELDSSRHWQRTMQGHAAANIVPLIASNRVGTEGADDDPSRVTFYGTSFIADYTGAVVAEADRTHGGRDHRHLRSRRGRRVPVAVGLVPRPPSRSLRRAGHARRWRH